MIPPVLLPPRSSAPLGMHHIVLEVGPRDLRCGEREADAFAHALRVPYAGKGVPSALEELPAVGPYVTCYLKEFVEALCPSCGKPGIYLLYCRRD